MPGRTPSPIGSRIVDASRTWPARARARYAPGRMFRRTFLVLLPLAACASPRTDWQRPTWTVVGTFDDPGLELGEDGIPRGAVADLLRQVAERGDRVLVWRRVEPSRALDLLETGRAEVAVLDEETLSPWGDRVDAAPASVSRLVPAPLGLRFSAARAGVLEAFLEDLGPRAQR